MDGADVRRHLGPPERDRVGPARPERVPLRVLGAGRGLQNFLLRHGSKEIPRADARPGDIIFHEQVAPGTETVPGETHHAAVVTSVTPDGDIKLTQHTSSFQNVSLDSREHIAHRNGGEQGTRIVRPEPNWY
nr:hypothetical protein [Streptomyces sp. WM6372]